MFSVINIAEATSQEPLLFARGRIRVSRPRSCYLAMHSSMTAAAAAGVSRRTPVAQLQINFLSVDLVVGARDERAAKHTHAQPRTLC